MAFRGIGSSCKPRAFAADSGVWQFDQGSKEALLPDCTISRCSRQRGRVNTTRTTAGIRRSHKIVDLLDGLRRAKRNSEQKIYMSSSRRLFMGREQSHGSERTILLSARGGYRAIFGRMQLPEKDGAAQSSRRQHGAISQRWFQQALGVSVKFIYPSGTKWG